MRCSWEKRCVSSRIPILSCFCKGTAYICFVLVSSVSFSHFLFLQYIAPVCSMIQKNHKKERRLL